MNRFNKLVGLIRIIAFYVWSKAFFLCFDLLQLAGQTT